MWRNVLFDALGLGRNAEITDDEKAWIINIACQKPTDFGYAAETWIYAKLTSHINKTAERARFMRLSTVHKSTVHTILDETEIKPFRIKYYCENRDTDFDAKMHNVLMVYKQLSIQFDGNGELLPFCDGDKYPEGDKIRIVLNNLKFIHQKKPENILPVSWDGLSLFLRLSMVHGSTWSKAFSAK